MRRFVRRTNMRRAHRKARGYILRTINKYAGAKRFLRYQGTITTSATPSTETQTNLLGLAIDAPADMRTPEAGARLESITFKAVSPDFPAGSIVDAILYVKRGNVVPNSTTPIADYLESATEPTPKANMEIRAAKLKFQHTVMPVNATFPYVFSYKMRFRKPIVFNQNTVLVFSQRLGVASKTLDWQIYCVFRK